MKIHLGNTIVILNEKYNKKLEIFVVNVRKYIKEIVKMMN